MWLAAMPRGEISLGELNREIFITLVKRNN
jgi:hypothetical protein